MFQLQQSGVFLPLFKIQEIYATWICFISSANYGTVNSRHEEQYMKLLAL
jgi:hypothetical protein